MTKYKPITPKKAKKNGAVSNEMITTVVKFLRKNFEINKNILTNVFEIVDIKTGEFVDKNDLPLMLELKNIRMSQHKINQILASSFSEFKVTKDINPVVEYLNSRRGKYIAQESQIELFASYLTPKKIKGNTPERWMKYFKKWFVSTVATALRKGKNDVMLVIVQRKGGTGKTKYIDFLIPPELEKYRITISKRDYKTNLKHEIATRFLINFDELAALNHRYILSFKSEISEEIIKTTHKYDHREVMLPRLASFAGSTNFNEAKGGFIQENDFGLMRRIFAVENEGFFNWQKYTKLVDINQMYSEAIMLIENSEFDYSFGPNDFTNFENFNRKYLRHFELAEILEKIVKKPTNGHYEKQTATELQQLLLDENYPENRISAVAIGTELSKMGFTQKSTKINGQSTKYWHVQFNN